MIVKIDISAVPQTRWYEYAIRFVFGGTITVITGVLAKEYGPAFGGLFLAFPAIFPASATLIDKHEKQKKLRAGIAATGRGRKAAALDARGAIRGSLGLISFAFIVGNLLSFHNAVLAMLAALALWLLVSTGIWWAAKSHSIRNR